jgi:hypothetical protein
MRYLAILLVLLFATTALGADNNGKNGKNGEPFWCNLQNKTQKLTPTKKSTAMVAVAGVKGAKNDGADLYWKGREKRVEIGEDEIHKFNVAVECQINGNPNQALQQFEAFLKEFPKSSLRTEGAQAVEMLKAELARQVSPEAAPPVPAPAQPAAVQPPATPAVTPPQAQEEKGK